MKTERAMKTKSLSSKGWTTVRACCVLILAGLATSWASEVPDGALEARVVGLSGLPPEGREAGQRFLVGSPGGNLYALQLLDGEALLFEVQESGRTEVAGELELLRPMPTINDLSISDDGALLVARSRGAEIRIFRNGSEIEPPQQPWMVTGVAVSRGEPLAALAPKQRGRARRGSELTGVDREPPAFVIGLAAERWMDRVPHAPPLGVAARESRRAGSTRAWETWIASGPSGELAVAYRAAYDVAIYDKRHRLRSRLRLDDGVISVETVPAHRDGKVLEVERASSRIAGLAWSPFKELILAVYAGQNDDGASLELHRYDPLLGETLTTPLRGVPEGSHRLAASKAGLWVWPALFIDEAFFVSWADLDLAGWRPLEVPEGG